MCSAPTCPTYQYQSIDIPLGLGRHPFSIDLQKTSKYIYEYLYLLYNVLHTSSNRDLLRPATSPTPLPTYYPRFSTSASFMEMMIFYWRERERRRGGGVWVWKGKWGSFLSMYDRNKLSHTRYLHPNSMELLFSRQLGSWAAGQSTNQ